MNDVSRRDFLKYSSGAALGAGLMMSQAGAQEPAAVSANDKIVVGFVGVGGRGFGHLSWFGRHPDVEIGAVCDLYKPALDRGVEEAAKYGSKKAPRSYSDFREMLEQKDIDVIVCATPPHWHPLVTILACQAGKDVYCEKPMALSPMECRAMVKAARENNRVTQIGTQIHANDNYHIAASIVQSGMLGKISVVRTQLALNEAPEGIGNQANEEPPADLNWDMWCGPLKPMPFNWSLFKEGHHRYFAETIGSWLHEMGPHVVDLAFMAMKPGVPLSAQAAGGKFVMQDISTIPDTMDVIYEYPDHIMTWSNSCANAYGGGYSAAPFQDPEEHGFGRRLGVTFQGDKGTLLANYDKYRIVSEANRLEDPKLPEIQLPASPGHEREFLDSVKSRKQPSCSVENHYPLAIALNLGNIAYKAGRKVRWDDEKGEIIGDAEANALAYPEYRAPWTLPV
ncbi:MAG: Gfo/Idh/MocA family oxidoreductase [FCB group bacterium]|jgi:predicted dehydrogenase|nr:Gfo/Idh/MocA family oxidoreductase [FCB group bacterium]